MGILKFIFNFLYRTCFVNASGMLELFPKTQSDTVADGGTNCLGKAELSWFQASDRAWAGMRLLCWDCVSGPQGETGAP